MSGQKGGQPPLVCRCGLIKQINLLLLWGSRRGEIGTIKVYILINIKVMRISAEADYHNYIIQWIIVNEFHEKK